MNPQYNDEYPALYDDYYSNNMKIEDIYDNSVDSIASHENDNSGKITRFPLRMPSVNPKEKDTYLCYSYDFTQVKEDIYIVGFEPNATMKIAHHILLYGCTEPGYKPGEVWACGEMSSNAGSRYKKGRTCNSGSQIIYAWARDAPKLELPEDVGFKIGRNSEVKSIVLQVHYANVDKFLSGGTDNSGITLKLTTKQLPKLAGVYLLGTGGIVDKGETHLQTSCTINQRGLEMHPFRFRTHTHTHGKRVAGYLIKKGTNKWIEIGEHDPLQPQKYALKERYALHYRRDEVLKQLVDFGVFSLPLPVILPLKTKPPERFHALLGSFKNGKALEKAAECIMQNNDGHAIPIGATHKDEMCNFYMMYWSMAPTISQQKYCFSNGPPFYTWKNDMRVPKPTPT
ncbi:Peptidylglycine alpha-hydroxylating monooxygenase [Nymphon striatum]|nr:Peptidylglycine alpha-hydroxylating monooxygenase [Nymphon striatum]